MPIILGIGVAAYVLSEIFEKEKAPYRKKRKKRPYKTPGKKKIFTSFSNKDKRFSEFLVQQANNKKSPFSFTDMSIRTRLPDAYWKEICRQKIKQCDGMIVLLSKNTWHSHGSRWEIKCAREEGIPVIGMHIHKDDKGAKPTELYGKKVIEWSWENLEEAIDRF